MATVEVTNLLIWYSVTPAGVSARIRTYAGDRAIEEKSIEPVLESDLTAQAQARGAQTWDETDICAYVGKETTWAAGKVIAQDVYSASELGLE